MDTKSKSKPEIERRASDYFLRLTGVLARYPVSPAEWWRGVKSGKYPPAIKLTARTTVWSASAIEKLIEEAKRGAQ
jgi:predicted DNA-binding transcriptional regulator AlpA